MTTFRTLATVRHHGMELTDYEFGVPLAHDQPSGETLSIFARAVRNSEAASAKRPWLVFLQGGPGFPGPRPLDKSGWLKRALDDYQVLLLDSRGNGRSSVVLPQTLARRGNARAQADYLMHFRADSIVRDAEAIRRQLSARTSAGACSARVTAGFAPFILSAYPHGLREVFIPEACRRSTPAPTTTIGRPTLKCSARRENSSPATRRTCTVRPHSGASASS